MEETDSAGIQSHPANGSVQVLDSEKKNEIEKEGEEKRPFSYKFKGDQSLAVNFRLPLIGQLRFNPVVTSVAVILIWIFVYVCIQFTDQVPFKEWKTWLVENFTWLYIGSQDVWAVFAIILYFSKYGDIRMGKPDEKPEYNDSTWFMMLFACGIGTGLFFFGVGEPIYHYTSNNRYISDPFIPDNTLAQIAMNITFYHWGVHGWICYSLVGLLLGLLSFREGLPMTMKSCFYPLIGDLIFGWIGDLIDCISIITTLFGVCTSLGLGTKQLNVGLNFLFPESIPPEDEQIQVIMIWCITAVATASTLSGVGVGIRRLSEICFVVGLFLMMVCLCMDNTFYILNFYTQSIGYYIQNIIQLGFHTDTFEQLGPSDGWKDRGRWLPEGTKYSDGPSSWMDSWTMFYWGWWISWCPFVGMFIAKISRGRTIRQFINGTLSAPCIFSFFWLIIFGGVGIRLERESAGAGLCCPDEVGKWFHENLTTIETNIGSSSLNTEIKFEELNKKWMCVDGNCGDCALSVIKGYDERNETFSKFLQDYKLLGANFGSVTPDRRLARLSCHGTEQMWFDVMRSYKDIGSFLAWFSLIGIVLYFVTSADSGSLVMDCLGSNGEEDPPRIQRVFWAVMEGATATALLVSGGKESLTMLQAAGILSGLPYPFSACPMCTAIWRCVKVAAGDLDPFGPAFEISLFEPFFPHPYKQLKKNIRKHLEVFGEWALNIVIAPWTVAKVYARLDDPKEMKIWKYAITPVVLFSLFILFHFLQLAFEGAWAIAWFWYLGFATYIAAVRIQVRERLGIVCGNAIEDFFAALLLYPNAAIQMERTTRNLENEQTEEPGNPKYNLKTDEAKMENPAFEMDVK